MNANHACFICPFSSSCTWKFRYAGLSSSYILAHLENVHGAKVLRTNSRGAYFLEVAIVVGGERHYDEEGIYMSKKLGIERNLWNGAFPQPTSNHQAATPTNQQQETGINLNTGSSFCFKPLKKKKNKIRRRICHALDVPRLGLFLWIMNIDKDETGTLSFDIIVRALFPSGDERYISKIGLEGCGSGASGSVQLDGFAARLGEGFKASKAQPSTCLHFETSRDSHYFHYLTIDNPEHVHIAMQYEVGIHELRMLRFSGRIGKNDALWAFSPSPRHLETQLEETDHESGTDFVN